ncbi:MAG: SDR family oxidoreductase [Pyrinomonadaceae bacterium]
MQLLEGKVAIINGAARGIGRACAELFAAHGARVVLSDIDEEPARAAADALKGAGSEFASPLSDYVSGQVLEVTGGL